MSIYLIILLVIMMTIYGLILIAHIALYKIIGHSWPQAILKGIFWPVMLLMEMKEVKYK